MDSTKKYIKKNPIETANIVSRLSYWWFVPFFYLGYKHDVQLKDIYNAPKADKSALWTAQLEANWEKEIKKSQKENRKPSLKTAICRTFFKSFILSGVSICFIFCFSRMILPILLAEYINYFNQTIEERTGVGWIWASAVILLTLVNIVFGHFATLSNHRVGMRVRVSVCSVMYRKLLKLNHTSLEQTASGQLINLLSNDVNRFDMFAAYFHYVWILPIIIVVAFYVMYRSVGIFTASVGMGAMVLESVPLQAYLSKLKGKYRYQVALKTDKRVKLMSEITSGIQVIKMYAWEKPFEKVVELSRKLEVNVIAKSSYVSGILASISIFTEKLTLYVTVVTLVLVGRSITGEVVFSMAQLFNTLQLIMCLLAPRGLTFYAETMVSIRRIESFLLQEETEIESINNTLNSDEIGDIKLDKVSASWTPNPMVPTLLDINLKIKPGTLCCVVGNVGAGKSSLLQLLIKELPLATGTMSINGKISYASQEPWLFVSTVRNNILFGKPYVQHKYREVVKVCSLERDFKQFPYKDKTLVGERGVSLSGGQRARVNLARAVYTEADIYLFDDPLSAVDTKVARHLFDECLDKYLNGKTRILVTHQLQFMKRADLIVIINDGKIEKVGSFNDFSENDLNVIQQKTENEEEKEYNDKEEKERKYSEKVDLFQSTTSLTSTGVGEDQQENEELIEKGSIPTSTYIAYWRSGSGILFLIFTCSLFIFAQIAGNAADMWLSHWTNIQAKVKLNSIANGTDISLLSTASPNAIETSLLPNATETSLLSNSTTLPSNTSLLEAATALPLVTLENLTNITLNDTTEPVLNGTIDGEEMKSRYYYISIYTALIFGAVLLYNLSTYFFYKVCMRSSKVLHNKMFHCILKAPMRFFDTNPSGRILSRFSKDMGTVDEILPGALIDAIQLLLLICGTLVVVFIITPWMIVPTIIFGAMFYWIRIVHLNCAQAIKRLEGTTRAFAFSHVTATLNGISTIRSSKAEQMITTEFDDLQDLHTSTYLLFGVCHNAFGFYLDVISNIFLALVTYQFLIFNNANTIGGTIGLVMSQSSILIGMLQFGAIMSAEAANNMVHVERVLQYTKLDKEGPFETLPGKKPPRDWPSNGKILFKNVYLRYAPDLPPVLMNMNLDIDSGEKIGIVGRTGAGKSTMIASLFRLAPIDGTISIDGVNTADLGLLDLRSNISIIPQEPTLFSASIRYNLDPFEKQSDDVLWKALEDVELKSAVTDLNQPITEGGANFSVGQRQLICLARAIVKNNKVLVMDEATANVDPQTDGLIQKTIRERFKQCTVLTVAHRLNTIMDSDRVLVMDAGLSMEFAHPYELLQKPEGYFSKMLKETDSAMEESLRQVARNAYEQKNSLLREHHVLSFRK